MKIYVFGNEDYEPDSMAVVAARKMNNDLLKKYGEDKAGIEFVEIKPNGDLPVDEKRIVIMDVVSGISKIKIFTENDLDDIELSPRNSVHDYDLAIQLKYLMKIGKVEEVRIVGLPMGMNVNGDGVGGSDMLLDLV